MSTLVKGDRQKLELLQEQQFVLHWYASSKEYQLIKLLSMAMARFH